MPTLAKTCLGLQKCQWASWIQKAVNMIDWNKSFSNANVEKIGKYTEWHTVQYFLKFYKK